MKIKNKLLLSITESDLINGHFYNDQITEIASNCFLDMETLISVDCPNVIKIGNICFYNNNSLTTLKLPLLNQCGYSCFRSNDLLTTLNLPLLNKCGKECFYNNNLLITLNFPLLKKCGNDCFSYNNSLIALNFPLLKKCGNDCFSSNNSLIALNFPLLKKCGNYCFFHNSSLTALNIPLLKRCDNNCFYYNTSLTTLNIGDKKLKVENVDGDCFVIENEKNKDGITIYSGYNLKYLPLESNDKCFVAKKDNFTAHGVDIHKAVEDLLYKISADKLKNEPVYPDTIVTIKHFKAITGACDLGMSDWKLQNNIIVDELKASELLILLEKTNAYGLDKFKQLYQNN